MLFFSTDLIGPVWPAMLFCFIFMAGTTLFLLLAHVRAWLASIRLQEYRFLLRLYDAAEMFSALAILSGMIGTCLGLFDALPVLGKSLSEGGTASTFASVLTPLRHVWVSTIVGLALGGLWGEILLFFLKPYTRTSHAPETEEAPPHDFDEDSHAGDALSGLDGEDDPNDDWRTLDKEGAYRP